MDLTVLAQAHSLPYRNNYLDALLRKRPLISVKTMKRMRKASSCIPPLADEGAYRDEGNVQSCSSPRSAPVPTLDPAH